MTQDAQDRCGAEYQALRATIRQRSTARICLFAIGLLAWAALTVATAELGAPPVAALIPLVALAAVFESVVALHVTVERIGRYLLVFHDDEWEQAAGSFGRPPRSAAIDPLFSAVFLIAAIVNLEPLLAVSPTVQELVFVGGAHALFLVRVIAARASAARQRAVDEERFRVLRGAGLSSPSQSGGSDTRPDERQ